MFQALTFLAPLISEVLHGISRHLAAFARDEVSSKLPLRLTLQQKHGMHDLKGGTPEEFRLVAVPASCSCAC
jgi:hypothetical protein